MEKKVSFEKNDKKWSCKLISFNLKNEEYYSKNKKWSCKLISFNLKNEKCHLKYYKKWTCIAGLSLLNSC